VLQLKNLWERSVDDEGTTWDGSVDSRCSLRMRIVDGCAARGPIDVADLQLIEQCSTANRYYNVDIIRMEREGAENTLEVRRGPICRKSSTSPKPKSASSNGRRCGSLDVSIDGKGAAFAEFRVGVLVSKPPDPSKSRTSTLKKRTSHGLRSIRRRGIAETVRVAHASAPLSIPRVSGDANNSASLS